VSKSAPVEKDIEGLPNAEKQKERFLSRVFPLVDAMLHAFKDLDAFNPLSPLVFETGMILRELLCCYHMEGLHNVALESVNRRQFALKSSLSQIAQSAPVKLQDILEYRKQGSSTWIKESVSCKLEGLYIAKQEIPVLDLRSVVAIQELHNGKDASFRVIVKNNNEKKLESVYYRASSDAKRQRWMNLLYLYQQRNMIQYYLSKLSFRERLYINNNVAFAEDSRQATGLRWDKRHEFLFATQNLAAIRPVMDTAGDLLGIRERFVVTWTRLGYSAKTRILEIDLGRPHRLMVFKEESDLPTETFLRKDFLDYKVNLKTMMVKLCFLSEKKGAVYGRNFTFSSLPRCRRFLDLLVLFQAPPDEQRIGFVHQDLLEFLNSVWGNTKTRLSLSVLFRSGPELAMRVQKISADDNEFDEGSQTEIMGEETELPTIGRKNGKGFDVSKIFQSQIHHLMVSMGYYAEKNSHCFSLKEFSLSLDFSPESDIRRVQAFLMRIFGFCQPDVEATHLKCACDGESTASNGGLSLCILQLVKAFLACYGLETMRRVLQSSPVNLKKWALRAIFRVFQVKHLTVQCQGAIEATNIRPSPAAADWNTVGDHLANDYCPENYPFPWYVLMMSHGAPLQSEVLDVLFEILTNQVRATEGKEAKLDPEDAALELMSKDIVSPQLLPLILVSLGRSVPVAQEHALKNFILLLKTKPQNCHSFFQSSGWQQWVLPLFNQDSNSELYKLAMSLLSSLCFLWMQTYGTFDQLTIKNDDADLVVREEQWVA